MVKKVKYEELKQNHKLTDYEDVKEAVIEYRSVIKCNI